MCFNRGGEIPDQVRDEEVQDRNDGYGTSRDCKKSPFYGTSGVNVARIRAERGVFLAAITKNLPILGTSGANAAEAGRFRVEPGMRGEGNKIVSK